MIAGGNIIKYHGKLTTRTVDLTTSNVLCNSVLSTEDAKFMGIGIVYFYLGNSHGSVWVYENRFEYISTAHHRLVWSTIKSKKWPCLSQNQTRHLWIITSRISCNFTTPKIPCSRRILWTRPHTITLVARHKTYSVHIGCRWFWGQIFRSRTYQSPPQHH